MNANNMDLTIPYQAFIDNEFVDSSNGNTFNTINPTNEEVAFLFYCLIQSVFKGAAPVAESLRALIDILLPRLII